MNEHLSVAQLSPTELSAARLDGDVFDVGGSYVSISIPETAELRARSLGFDPWLIPERESALWVFGVLSRAPCPPQLCIAAGAGIRAPVGHRAAIREVVLEEGDLVSIGGVALTSPLRTAIDVARLTPVFTRCHSQSLSLLFEQCALTVEAAEERMRRSSRLPDKRRALVRLRAAAASIDRGTRSEHEFA